LADDAGASEFALLLGRVGDLVRGAVVTVPELTSARDAARLMAGRGVGSVVVTDSRGAAIGIVTDRDLRTRLVAAGRDPAAPVREIMSTPVLGIGHHALAFEALVEMTRGNVHHLGVFEGDRLVGVVSSSDFTLLEGAHPVALSREIERQASLEGLKGLMPRVAGLVARLARAGADPIDIGRIVAEISDRVVQRVIALTQDALAAAGEPAPSGGWAWLALGSEGRREQTLVTDQDNALVYADPVNGDRAPAAYFRSLGERAVAGLVAVGFPPCPGQWMASNPRWCQPLRAWLDRIDRWIDAPDVSVVQASIVFDLRPVAGDARLASTLRRRIGVPSVDRRRLLRFLARDVVDHRSALGWLGGLRTDRGGRVDVKRYGVFPLVGAVRVLALDHGVVETGTVDRLGDLAARRAYPPERADELARAYRFLLGIRLRHQIAQVEARQAPDNLVDWARLSRPDRLLLRESMRVVDRARADLRDRYQTDLVR
jgi:CBS domain-containing protein